MKSMRTFGIMAGALALLLAGLTSARATVIIDPTTKGSWLGKYGSGALGGSSAYILCDYHNGVSPATPASDYASASLSSFVTSYSYSSGAAGPPYVYWGGTSASASALQDPLNAGVRFEAGYMDWSATGFNISLTLAPTAPDQFQLAVYSFSWVDGYASDNPVTLYWGAPTPNPGGPDTTNITAAEMQAGTWIVFDVQRNGRTQLNIENSNAAMAGGFTVFNAIMFDQIIPEPSTAMLLGVGAGLFWLRRRNR